MAHLTKGWALPGQVWTDECPAQVERESLIQLVRYFSLIQISGSLRHTYAYQFECHSVNARRAVPHIAGCAPVHTCMDHAPFWSYKLLDLYVESATPRAIYMLAAVTVTVTVERPFSLCLLGGPPFWRLRPQTSDRRRRPSQTPGVRGAEDRARDGRRGATQQGEPVRRVFVTVPVSGGCGLPTHPKT